MASPKDRNTFEDEFGGRLDDLTALPWHELGCGTLDTDITCFRGDLSHGKEVLVYEFGKQLPVLELSPELLGTLQKIGFLRYETREGARQLRLEAKSDVADRIDTHVRFFLSDNMAEEFTFQEKKL